MDQSLNNIPDLLHELNEIGIALSAEKDHDRLLELILIKAMDITNSDGGTLYVCTNEKSLKFEILHNRTLAIHKGGTSGEEILLPSISLYDDEGNKNNKMVAAYAVNSAQTINIKDASKNEDFDFSGTRNFDKKMGYRSISFLTVPMTNHEHDIIGVLQLINTIDKNTNKIISFSALDQQLIESLASQAAVTITNRTLINAQKNLFDSFIQLIATAIDEKSPYTAKHCRRVPVITDMLADATNKIDRGPLKDFSMNDYEMYELNVAAWLHDCGKITTPEYVVDKSTKLETIFDRINLVDIRFEVLRRDAVITALKAIINKNKDCDDIVKDKIDDDVQRGSDSKTQALLWGIFTKHYFYLASGDEERADNYYDMAKQIHGHYTDKFKNSPERMGIAPFEVYRITRLRAFLMEEDSVVTGALRTQLGLGKDEMPEVPKVPDPGQ